MTKREIALSWERAEYLALTILEASYTGKNIEQARRNQKSLAIWLNIVKTNGYVYNGIYDECLLIKL